MAIASELIRQEPVFGELFERVSELEILLPANISSAEKGSALANDDMALNPLRLTSSAQLALMVAIDHLRAVRVLLDAGIPAVSGFTLLRTAIESAATVVWLLAPTDPLQRATRQLRNLFTDNKDLGTTVTVIAGRKWVSTATEEALHGKAISLGVKVPLTRVSAAEILVDIQDDVLQRDGAGPSDTPIIVTWRFLSAAAHGRGHFFDLLLSSERNAQQGANESNSTKFWADPKLFAAVLGLAVTLTEIAGEIYAERADASAL